MRFPQDAEGWPLRAHSTIHACPPHRWHVQIAGHGPILVLIHGAGGTTQSWRGLFPILAQDWRVVAMDLPGQGFTRSGAPNRLGLAPMAQDIGALLADLDLAPAAFVGHSAGAALALLMSLEGPYQGLPVVGLNAALAPFRGVAGWLFPWLARTLALTPFPAALFARTSTEGGLRSLIRSTGSSLPDEGVALYLRLARDAGHVDATLGMMAQWDLSCLLPHLARHPSDVTLIVGDRDGSVPPDVSVGAAATMPRAHLVRLPALGHLAHEEAPEVVAEHIRLALKTPRATGIPVAPDAA